MDLFIERDQLVRGLQRVQGIVERRTTNNALAHVLLNARGSSLRMTASDTMVTLVADYPATIRAENDLGVDAQHFFRASRQVLVAAVAVRAFEAIGRGRLRVDLLESLAAFTQAGARKIDAWTAQHQQVVVPFDQPGDDPLAFFNANTLAELHRLEGSGAP